MSGSPSIPPPNSGGNSFIPLPIKDKIEQQASDWSIDKIRQIFDAFVKERTLFVHTPEAAESINKQKQTSDYKLIQEYVSYDKYRHLLIAGLALRDLETRGDTAALGEELSSIYHSTSATELRIAEFSQIGLFARMVSIIQKPGMTREDIKKQVHRHLSLIEHHFRPVRSADSLDRLYEEIRLNIIYSKPDFYMMIAKNSANCSNMKTAIQRLEQEDYLFDYTKNEDTNEKGAKLVIFIRKDAPPDMENYISIGHFI